MHLQRFAATTCCALALWGCKQADDVALRIQDLDGAVWPDASADPGAMHGGDAGSQQANEMCSQTLSIYNVLSKIDVKTCHIDIDHVNNVDLVRTLLWIGKMPLPIPTGGVDMPWACNTAVWYPDAFGTWFVCPNYCAQAPTWLRDNAQLISDCGGPSRH